ncbi:hypothetical protein HER39_08905 [Arthrobacter deserti]|uniref:ABM domain-containing protein n=1 Tax=Arthrobacter deserti TaxID=1742687 RepID=A0ABX1JN02_9MICC|nr:hypothetical protein [Arthrobacter deserti]
MDDETYRQVVEAIGGEPLGGLILHLCVRKEGGGLRYIVVWESEEQCTAAFEQRIHPAVEQVLGGQRPATEPEVTPLEVVDVRGRADGARHAGGAVPSEEPPHPSDD